MKKSPKKYLLWLGWATCLVALILGIGLYQEDLTKQQFLKEGKRVEAFLGMKSRRWYDTKEWFWEVSYWVPRNKRPKGRLVNAKIMVDKVDYYQYREEERVWVYYLKKKPRIAMLEFQIKQPINFFPTLVCLIIGIISLLIARIVF